MRLLLRFERRFERHHTARDVCHSMSFEICIYFFIALKNTRTCTSCKRKIEESPRRSFPKQHVSKVLHPLWGKRPAAPSWKVHSPERRLKGVTSNHPSGLTWQRERERRGQSQPEAVCHSTRTGASFTAPSVSNKRVALGLFGSTMRRSTHLAQRMLTLLPPRQQTISSHPIIVPARVSIGNAACRYNQEAGVAGWKWCTLESR